MGEPGEAADTTGGALLRECCRVAAQQGGTLLIVSLLQAHVLRAVLHAFRAGWVLRIQQVPAMRDMAANKLQPFLVTACAQEGAGAHVAAVELLGGEEAPAGSRPVNASQLADIRALVAAENEERQRVPGAALGGMPPGGDVYAAVHPGRIRQVALGPVVSPGLGPRFVATVVDAHAGQAPGSRLAAVFLVPQGREHEWLFANEEGQQQLAANCSAQRLVIVCLGRGHVFGTSAAVQAELSPLVLPLLPLTCRGTATGAVPILSMADGLGSRTLVAQAASGLSGGVVVEDVTLQEEGEDGGGLVTYRRLIFTATPTLVQSEMRMLGPQGGGVDLSHLCCAYHAAIIAGLGLTVPAFAPGSSTQQGGPPASVTVIGLGGGALPLFLVEHFPHVRVHVVELDPVVGQLAAEHFAFNTAAYDSRLSLAIGDGLQAVADIRPGGSVDAIVVDASDSDPSLGMTCPPAPFVEPAFLHAAAAGLAPDGSLVINVVTRSQEAFAATLAAVSAVFPFVYQADTEDDVNRVLFARTTKATGTAADAAAALDAVALKPWSRGVLDVEALAAGLRLLTTHDGGA